MFLDVKKAHLTGKLREDEWAFVVLPTEAGGGVAPLRRWLYWMRPAAKAWEDDYAQNLRAAGYNRGHAAPTVFHEPVGDVSLVVHGDDVTARGPIEELNKLESTRKGRYDVNTRGRLGPEKNDCKEIKIQNRKVEWADKKVIYEADQKSPQTILRELGLGWQAKTPWR